MKISKNPTIVVLNDILSHIQRKKMEAVKDGDTEAIINFCECNQFKYEWRAGLKEGNSAEQDRAKAMWYENKAKELKGL